MITEMYANFDLATGADDGTSEADAYKTWASMKAATVAGDRVNFKKTASRHSSVSTGYSFATSSTDLLPIIFRGYETTITDGVKMQFLFGGTSSASMDITGEGLLIQNFDVEGSSTNDVVNCSGDCTLFESCIIVNTGTTAALHTGLRISDAYANNCYIETNGTSATSYAVRMQQAGLSNCTAVSTRVGIYTIVGSTNTNITGCLIYAKGASSTTGVEHTGGATSGGPLMINTTINGFPDAVSFDVIDGITSTVMPVILDCIMSNATNGIINGSATQDMAIYLSTIAFFNVTTPMYAGDKIIVNQIALSVDPYVDASTNDFSLNDTAGGGTDCRNARLFSAGV